MNNISSKISRHSSLLISLLFFIFGLPFLLETAIAPYVTSWSIAIILASEFLLLEIKRTYYKYFIFLAIIFTVLLPFIEKDYFAYITYIYITFVFIFTAGLLLAQIAQAKTVNSSLIMEAVIGYLLLGVILVIINKMIVIYNQEAFTFSHLDFADSIYYSFITLTAIGYGDLSPVSKIAKSVAVFGGLAGQLYLTIIIAFIIGKYTSNRNK